MNIKSLILGSAAALVACGSAQAADLPVAEPVDYVKVCDAYGAGYFFIPGTDTCLKIGGKVLFGVSSEGFGNDAGLDRADDLVNFYTETTFSFTAREETELGTLTAHMEFDDASDTTTAGGTVGNGAAIDKAYIMLGGFYAGLTDSLLDFNAGLGYDDYGFGFGDLNTIGYKADMGNGVTAAIALEEFNNNEAGAGTSMPAVTASLSVAQGWGSLVVGAGVHQVRYTNSATSTDFGFAVGGEGTFNIAEGLTFGLAGGYGTRISNLAAGIAAGSLAKEWLASAGLAYAFADNMTLSLDAGYKSVNDFGTTGDFKGWGTSLMLEYVPVKNLSVTGKVGYQKMDYHASSATADWDDVAAKIEIERTF
ncbi:porin [Cohaesibacter celericrescens]|nr:porin [Cohaesibacter celericrescens]